MSKQTSIKVDPEAWEKAKEIFKEYDLTLSDAINIFLNKVRLEGGMPFEIKLPHSSRMKQNETNLEKDNDIPWAYWKDVELDNFGKIAIGLSKHDYDDEDYSKW